ncbi:MAG: ABC transporter ATP-binding protein [Deltaproteobacteria bacterium]|nr:ABC transporter ATP-binding protein [Deltaproteobacteria bacterium]
MIEIDNLQKSYGAQPALRGVSLRIPAGQLFAYLGPNGAGKTTTIRILTGLTRPTGGAARLGGHDIAGSALAAKKECGVVAQAVNLDSELTVNQNLELHGRLYGMTRAERRSMTQQLLAYVDLEAKADQQVKALSGGMKRRVMIARALLHSPRILFLDEPTAGLDPAIRRRIWSLIRRIHRDGATVFLTTHYIEEAEFLAERVAFLDQGQIVALDSPQRLMAAQGAWALDLLHGEELQTHYFPDREKAREFLGQLSQGATLRRVNLEDAFLAMTGKRIG